MTKKSIANRIKEAQELSAKGNYEKAIEVLSTISVNHDGITSGQVLEISALLTFLLGKIAVEIGTTEKTTGERKKLSEVLEKEEKNK